MSAGQDHGVVVLLFSGIVDMYETVVWCVNSRWRTPLIFLEGWITRVVVVYGAAGITGKV